MESALEKSHRGGHLWIFLAEPLPARDCRIYACGLRLRFGIPVKGGRRREGIEVFPKHDALKPGRYGNALRGPLGIHRGAAQRFWNEPGVMQGIWNLRDPFKATGRMLFVATCNSIASPPPELRRRFRLGTFFFDLPSDEERETISVIYLKKYNVSGELPNDEGWKVRKSKSAAERRTAWE